MSQERPPILTARATKLSVLGQHMRENRVPKVEFHVPCLDRSGILIPVLGGTATKYTMPEFGLSVVSLDETGGGIITLTPKPSESHASPRVGLPIYHPEDMTQDNLNAMADDREGFSELRTTFDVEINEAGRPIGTAAMFGVLNDGTEQLLPYEAGPMDAYLEVVGIVGTSKLKSLIATRRAMVATQIAEAPEFAQV